MIKNRVTASRQYGLDAQTDVFTVSHDGQLQVAWAGQAAAGNGPVGLGPVGVFPPGAAVTASPQYGLDNQTDVFAVANNGQLQVAWAAGSGGWNGPVEIVLV